MRSYANFPHWQIGTIRVVRVSWRGAAISVDFLHLRLCYRFRRRRRDGRDARLFFWQTRWRIDVAGVSLSFYLSFYSSWELAIPDTRGANVNSVEYVYVYVKSGSPQNVWCPLLNLRKDAKWGEKINDIWNKYSYMYFLLLQSWKLTKEITF